MKKLSLAIIADFAISYSFAQTNTFPWPSSGNVGIGTTSPTERLDIEGNIKLNGNLTFALDQTEYFIHPAGNGGAIRLRSNILTGSDRNVQFGIIDNVGTWHSAMIIENNGYVGIGTITPQAKFHAISVGSSSNTVNEFSGDIVLQPDQAQLVHH